MLFNKKGRTELHCAKLKESVTLLILLCLGHWVERIEKDRQLQWTKTGSEKDLELVTSCGCSICNWNLSSDIKKIERLAKE